MKKLIVVLLAVVALTFGLVGTAMAGDTATNDVSIVVQAIDEISVTGSASLTINASTATGFAAGDSLFTVTDNSNVTYGVTTNSAVAKKITAHLNTAITETLVKLYITLASASGVSDGETEITSVVAASPASVVTGLLQEADSSQVLTYKATAEVTSPIGTVNKTVTLTLINEA